MPELQQVSVNREGESAKLYRRTAISFNEAVHLKKLDIKGYGTITMMLDDSAAVSNVTFSGMFH